MGDKLTHLKAIVEERWSIVSICEKSLAAAEDLSRKNAACEEELRCLKTELILARIDWHKANVDLIDAEKRD